MNHDIMIFAEQRDGVIQSISYELIRGAGELADKICGKVVALLLGCRTAGAADTLANPPANSPADTLADTLAAAGADEVLVIDHPVLSEYLAAPYTKAVAEAVRLADPEIVLFGSTTIGMELAPRAAGRLNTGLVTDCTGLAIDPESRRLLMTRPNLDGISIDTFICEERRPQMATVRPGVLGAVGAVKRGTQQGKIRDTGNENPNSGSHNRRKAARIRLLPADFLSHSQESQGIPEVRILSTDRGRKRTSDITQARILVAGGRGVGGPEGFEPLRTIAGLLGGEIACSRACVEAGWIDTSPQVGQTGKTVRPDLYLACGISGAFQHVTGMEGSKLIISINKNSSAPIFDISDLGIVGNVEVILPQLIEAIEQYKA